MDKIKFELDARQAELLMQAIYIHECVTEENEDIDHKDLHSLSHDVLKAMYDSSFKKGIEHDEKDDTYALTEEQEDEFLEILDEHDGNQFWESLIEQLAARDIATRYTEKEIMNQPLDQRLRLIEKEEDKYRVEFSTHGLKRLKL